MVRWFDWKYPFVGWQIYYSSHLKLVYFHGAIFGSGFCTISSFYCILYFSLCHVHQLFGIEISRVSRVEFHLNEFSSIIIFRKSYRWDYFQSTCVEWQLHGSSSNAPQVSINVQMTNCKIYKCVSCLAFADWPTYRANANGHSCYSVGRISDCTQGKNTASIQSIRM